MMKISPLNVKLQNLKENLIGFGFMFGLLIATRLVFYNFFSHYWIGTIGILSATVFILFYLSKKGKLGKLGNIFLKRIFKRLQGRSFKFFLIQSIFVIYLFSLFTIGASYASPEVTQYFKNDLKKQNIVDMPSLVKAEEKPHILSPQGYLASLIILFTPNPILFSVISVINEFTNGWFISIFTVGAIEEAEFLGIILYFRYFASQNYKY